MVGFAFYSGTYMGGSIPELEYSRIEAGAKAQLAQYKRMYRVTSPTEDSEAMAVCAMADTIYYYETAQNGGLVTSTRIGSVSSSTQASTVDTSPKAQAKELYRCACLYLDIYRGCR